MARYFTTKASKAAVFSDEIYSGPMLNTVTVSDHEATDTGLLDADGDTIWRAPNPMGFCKDDEW